MSAVVEAKELSRWYGVVLGLNNVSFEIGPGITGLVGPNGAGKSTLIQLITGQIRPSSGVLTVFGERPWNNRRLLSRLGYCPESEAVHADIKPLGWLRSLGALSGMSRRELRTRPETVLETVGLDRAHWDKPLGKFSKGMRQRVKLAQAILAEPDLLILDEPMNGLDPMGRGAVADLLKSMADKGTHIIVSSHILPELEALCHSILLMRWGRVVTRGDSNEEEIDEASAVPERLIVRCDCPRKLLRLLFERELITGFQLSAEDATAMEIETARRGELHRQWKSLIDGAGVTVYEIRSLSRSLASTFNQLTS